MPLQFRCPFCSASQVIPDQAPGQSFACAQCGKVVRIAGQPSARDGASPPNVNPTAATTPIAKPVAPPLAAPVAARRPMRRSKSNAAVYVVVIVSALTMTTGITLAIVFWPGRPSPAPPGRVVAGDKPKPKSDAPKPNRDDAKTVKPELTPVEEPEPETPPPSLPAQIDAAALKKAKQATVYLKVTEEDGLRTTGSGFFALEPGVVVTNAHVLGMKFSQAKPRNIQIIVHSGTPEELNLSGTVLAVDPVGDLAAVRVVGGDAKALPQPLPIADSRHLTEVQKTYVLGFPFGENLGKDITVSDTSISSLRKEADGSIKEVQVRGGMNPGNSGGPLVDTRGHVIGVAVMGLKGTEINLAIPGDAVRDLLDGRVVTRTLGEPFLDEQQAKVRMSFDCLDPLQRIKELKVVVWTGDVGAPKPASWRSPAQRKGDGPRIEIAALYKNGKASIEVPLPKLPKDKMYWLQPVLVNGSGKPQWLAVEPWEPAAPPLERRPALLTHKLDARERKTQITSESSATIVAQKQSHLFKLDLQANLDETVLPAAGNEGPATLRVTLPRVQFDIALDGIPRLTNEFFGPVRSGLSKLTTDWRLASDGTIQIGAVNLDAVPERVRKDVRDFQDRLALALELASIHLPNRELPALASWSHERRWNKASLNVIATYEGRRLHQKREEAHVSLRGTLKGIGLDKNGNVEGSALVDLTSGFVARVDLKVETDIDVPFIQGQLKAKGIFDVKLTRDVEK